MRTFKKSKRSNRSKTEQFACRAVALEQLECRRLFAADVADLYGAFRQNLPEIEDRVETAFLSTEQAQSIPILSNPYGAVRLGKSLTNASDLNRGKPEDVAALTKKLQKQKFDVEYADPDVPNEDGHVLVVSRDFGRKQNPEVVRAGGEDPFDLAPNFKGKLNARRYRMSGSYTVGMRADGTVDLISVDVLARFDFRGELKGEGTLGVLDAKVVAKRVKISGEINFTAGDRNLDGVLSEDEVEFDANGEVVVEAKISVTVQGAGKISWRADFRSDLLGDLVEQTISPPRYENVFSKLEGGLRDKLSKFKFSPVVDKVLIKPLPFIGSVGSALRFSPKLEKSLAKHGELTPLPAGERAAAMAALTRGEEVPLFGFSYADDVNVFKGSKELFAKKLHLIGIVEAKLSGSVEFRLDVGYQYQGSVTTKDVYLVSGSGFDAEGSVHGVIKGEITVGGFTAASARASLGLEATAAYQVDCDGSVSFRQLRENPRDHVAIDVDVDLVARLTAKVLGIKVYDKTWKFDIVRIVVQNPTCHSYQHRALAGPTFAAEEPEYWLTYVRVQDEFDPTREKLFASEEILDDMLLSDELAAFLAN